MEKNFIIFNVSELPNINFAEVKETSVETVRKSIDGQKTFIEWIGNTPTFVSSLNTIQGTYSYSEILEIMNGVEWKPINNFVG
jgi:hypothetical protein